MANIYYFISDLHISGDSTNHECEFEDELIQFLETLRHKNQDIELIIVGDAFGLWEMTETAGIEKLTTVVHHHQRLFEQFRRTGEHIQITIIPGNHDHELVCYLESQQFLQNYNIHLEQKEYITRTIGEKRIWIEHGHQHDDFNQISSFGNPHATPLGYYTTQKFVVNGHKYTRSDKQHWFKDLQSVYPKKYIPHWIFSNYFYKEMNPVIRAILVPFLRFLTIDTLLVVGLFLQFLGVWLFPENMLRAFPYLEGFIRFSVEEHFGSFGPLFDVFFRLNFLFILFVLFLALIISLFLRDIRRVFIRYGVTRENNLLLVDPETYRVAAQNVFAENQDVVAYIYGHTHLASIAKLKNRVIINTGSWLKRLQRVPARFRWFPDMYSPSFRLSYFVLYQKQQRIVIQHQQIRKTVQSNLTRLQGFVILKTHIADTLSIPDETFIDLRELDSA